MPFFCAAMRRATSTGTLSGRVDGSESWTRVGHSWSASAFTCSTICVWSVVRERDQRDLLEPGALQPAQHLLDHLLRRLLAHRAVDHAGLAEAAAARAAAHDLDRQPVVRDLAHRQQRHAAGSTRP